MRVTSATYVLRRGALSVDSPAPIHQLFSRHALQYGMPKISAHAVVGSPPATTKRLLQEYVAQHGRSDGTVSFSLRVPLLASLTDDLSLAHDVLVRFWQGRTEDHLGDVLLVEWTPSGEGPYPTFSGVVNIVAEADARTARIEIDGTYDPPGGMLGRAFDAVLGHRLAQISVGDLVQRLARELTPVASSETRR